MIRVFFYSELNIEYKDAQLRFIVDSNAKIHLAEELCTKPTSCLTIFLADQTTQEFKKLNYRIELFFDEIDLQLRSLNNFK